MSGGPGRRWRYLEVLREKGEASKIPRAHNLKGQSLFRVNPLLHVLESECLLKFYDLRASMTSSWYVKPEEWLSPVEKL